MTAGINRNADMRTFWLFAILDRNASGAAISRASLGGNIPSARVQPGCEFAMLLRHRRRRNRRETAGLAFIRIVVARRLGPASCRGRGARWRQCVPEHPGY